MAANTRARHPDATPRLNGLPLITGMTGRRTNDV